MLKLRLPSSFTAQIGRLEATRLSQEATIQDLKSNIGNLQGKLNGLEGEREELEKKCKTHTQDSQSQLLSLKKVQYVLSSQCVG